MIEIQKKLHHFESNVTAMDLDLGNLTFSINTPILIVCFVMFYMAVLMLNFILNLNINVQDYFLVS